MSSKRESIYYIIDESSIQRLKRHVHRLEKEQQKTQRGGLQGVVSPGDEIAPQDIDSATMLRLSMTKNTAGAYAISLYRAITKIMDDHARGKPLPEGITLLHLQKKLSYILRRFGSNLEKMAHMPVVDKDISRAEAIRLIGGELDRFADRHNLNNPQPVNNYYLGQNLHGMPPENAEIPNYVVPPYNFFDPDEADDPFLPNLFDLPPSPSSSPGSSDLSFPSLNTRSKNQRGKGKTRNTRGVNSARAYRRMPLFKNKWKMF